MASGAARRSPRLPACNCPPPRWSACVACRCTSPGRRIGAARASRTRPVCWAYSQLAEACRAEFGDRAPDADAIRAWWLANGTPADPRERIACDPEVATAIRDLAGRVRVPDIRRALAERFPAERVPGRSTLYRYVSALLTRDALEGR